MLKFLLSNAIRHPGKLLALCIVAYLATMSFFVAGLLILLAGRWVQKSMQQKVKAFEEAEAAKAKAALVEADKAQTVKAQAAQTVAPAATRPAANDNAAAPSTPTRQYAKSAVVIPFRTGTR